MGMQMLRRRARLVAEAEVWQEFGPVGWALVIVAGLGLWGLAATAPRPDWAPGWSGWALTFFGITLAAFGALGGLIRVRKAKPRAPSSAPPQGKPLIEAPWAAMPYSHTGGYIEVSEPPPLPKRDPAESEPDDQWAFVGPGDIAPSTLIAYFASHSSLEANKLIEVYKGQRIKRLTGVVADILGSGDSPAVMLYIDRAFNYVLAYFGQEWEARVTAKQPGSRITMSGTIKEGGRTYVMLEDCELVE